MSDRELLELAAKAMGKPIKENECLIIFDETPDPNIQRLWNPLKNDGDALRLAVNLGLSIEVHTKRMEPHTVVWFDVGCCVEEGHWDDADRATRRAIVRAAAEIGKSKP